MDNIIECRQLVKKYHGTPALCGIDLDIKKGKIVGLLGPNGSGKTTFIKLLNGLLSVDGGTVLIDGKEIGVETKSVVSYLPDSNFLSNSATTEEMMRYFEDFFPDFRREKAEKMLEALSIDPKKKIKTLSKGNKEKVALILVMSRQAKLYLLDEPIAGVDPATRDYILRTIIQNYSDNATVIISTHLIADVEPILDEAIFIKNGNIVLNESVDDIREKRGMSVDALFREEFRC